MQKCSSPPAGHVAVKHGLIISILIVLVSLFLLASLPICESDGETGDTFAIDNITYEIKSDTEVCVTGSTETELTIPSDVTYNSKNYNVTSIKSNAFLDNTELISVVIGENITSIGSYAFSGCTSLSSINLGDRIVSIESFTFSGCKNLISIDLSKIKRIDRNAFSNCTSLTKVTLTNVETIYSQSFYSCSNLSTVEVGVNVESIGSYAFSGCTSLSSIVLGDKISCIEDGTFSGCSKLTSVTYGSNVKSIGRNAFSNCTNLSSISLSYIDCIGRGAFYCCSCLAEVTLGKNITSIEKSTFYGCSSLSCVNLNGNLSSIGDGAFEYCTSLTSIVLGDNIKTIGKYVFCGCTGLESITIGDGVECISSDAFRDCSILSSVVGGNNIKTIDSYAFYYCSALKSITLGNKVEKISAYAFWECTSLFSITIPSSVTSIHDYAFYYCTGLKSLIYESALPISNEMIDSWGALETVTLGTNVININDDAFSGCSTLKTVIFKGDIKSIGENSFYGCKSLTSIDLGDTTESIGENAFYGCSSLESLTVPESVRSIGDGAFTGLSSLKTLDYQSLVSIESSKLSCQNVESVIIGDNVSSLGKVFNNCSSLQTIQLGIKITSVRDSVFSGCTSLSSITFGDNLNYIGERAFYNCTSLSAIDLGDSLRTISDSAFELCTSLKSITIPESVIYIGDYAFSGCTGLKTIVYESAVPIDTGIFSDLTNLESVTLNDQITEVSENLFKNCSKLVSVNLGGNIKIIGDNAFRGCSGLSKIDLGEKIESIGKYAFYKCTSLTEIDLGDNIRTISKFVLAECSNLISIDFGNNVETIEDYAFYGCSSLKSIDLGDSIQTIGMSALRLCSSLSSVSFGDSLKSIGDLSFADCVSLPSFIFPSSLEYLGDSAFYRCDGLVSIEFDDCSVSIADSTFYSCDALKEIDLGTGVKSIGANAFEDCFSLESMEIGSVAISKDSFKNCTSLSSVTISGITNMDESPFAGCSSLKSVIFSGLGSTIGSNVFKDFTYIQTLDLSGVVSIDRNGFYGCTALETVEFGNNIETIGDSAFCNCSAIKSIILPDSLTSLGQNAFKGCTSAVEIKLSNRLTFIGQFAFMNCTSLKSVVFPDSITSLHVSAFNGCTSLESYTFGVNMSELGGYSFKNCTSLKSLNIPSTITQICYDAFEGCTGVESIEFGDFSKVKVGASAFTLGTSISPVSCSVIGCPEGSLNDYSNNYTIFAYSAYSKISFDTDGGDPLRNIIVPENGKFKLPDCHRDGYELVCWKIGDTEYSVGQELQPTSDMTFTAEWFQTHVVTFDTNGSYAIDSRTVRHNYQTVLPAVYRSGYRFVQWDLDEDTHYSAGDRVTVTEDINLKAVWIKQYTIEFDSNGGSSVKSIVADTGSTVVIPGSERAKYRFVQWDADNDTHYNAGDSIVLETDLDLTAVWVYQYTLTFNTYGGEQVGPFTVDAGSDFEMPDCSRDGFVFKKWKYNDRISYDAGDTLSDISSNMVFSAIWACLHTMSFSTGLGSSIDDMHVEDGTVFEMPVSILDHHRLTNWKTSDGTTYSAGQKIEARADMAFTAEWVHYNIVTFDPNGGSKVEQQNIDDGSLLTVPSTTKDNHRLKYWVDADKVQYLIGSQVELNSDITLYADWIEVFTVTFNSAKGSSVEPMHVDSGTVITIPVSTRTDYSLVHWKTDNTAYEPTYDVGDKVTITEDLKLTAEWVRLYKVSFDLHYDNLKYTYQVKDGTDYQLPDYPRTGYELDHWVIADDEYDIGQSVTITADTTFTAVWEKLCKIEFKDGDETDVSYLHVGDELSIPECSKDHYRFLGWKCSGDMCEGSEKITVTEDMEFVAQWVYLCYLDFNAKGGTSVETIIVSLGDTITIPGSEKDDKSLLYWISNDQRYYAGESLQVGSDMSFTAFWADIYRITFDPNGGSDVDSITYTEGDSVLLPSCEIGKENARFKCWILDECEYYAGMSYAFDGDVTLAAHWQYLHTVSFETGCSSAIDTISVFEGDYFCVPGCDGKEGYVFKCWTSGGRSYSEGQQCQMGEYDMKMFAQWSKLCHIKFHSDGGELIDDMEVVEYDYFTLPDCSKDGNKLRYWKTSSSIYYVGKEYRIGNSDLDLTASWAPEYKITLMDNGEIVKEMTVYAYDYYELPICENDNAARRFTYWTDGENVYESGKYLVMGNSDLLLQASWVYKHTVTMRYSDPSVLSDPVVFSDSLSVFESDVYTLPYQQIENGKILYWLDQDQKCYYSGHRYVMGASDIVLDAVLAESFTITYDPKDGSDSFEVKVYEGDNFTAQTCSSHEDSKFVYWTDSDGHRYYSGTSYKCTSDLYLEANLVGKHTVFFCEGDEVLDEITLFEGEFYTAPEYSGTTERFKCWIDSAGKYYRAGQTYAIGSSDLTLIASWVPMHRIIFDSNGGESISEAYVYEGDKFSMPGCSILDDDHKFKYWIIGDKIYRNGSSFTMGDEDVTAVAMWAVKHTITLHPHDGDDDVTFVYYEGESFKLPSLPPEIDRKFGYWQGNIRYDAETAYIMPDYDLFLEARWFDKHTVTFRSETWAEPIVQYLYEGDECTVPDIDSSKEGYTFRYWCSNERSYLSGESFVVSSSDIIFSAVWKKNVTVSFDSNGGSIVDDIHACAGDYIRLPSSVIDDDHNLRCWCDPAGMEYKSDELFLVGEEDIELTASWASKYNLYFDTNGKCDTIRTSLFEGNSFTVPEWTSYDGSSSTEYWTGSDGKIYKCGKPYIMPANDLTLTAAWIGLFTVSFDVNGGSIDMPDKVNKGCDFYIPSYSGVCDHKRFYGWTYDKEIYRPGEKIEINGDITLTANWEEEYDIIFRDGDDIVKKVSVISGEGYSFPRTELYSGDKRFVGWECEDTTYPGNISMVHDKGDLEYVAVWANITDRIVSYYSDGKLIDSTTALETTTIIVESCNIVGQDCYFLGWLWNNEYYQAGDEVTVADEDIIFEAEWVLYPKAGQDFNMDGFLYLVNDDDVSVTITGYYSISGGQLTISPTVTLKGLTYKITGIGTFAFSECQTITGLCLSDNITDIGVGAFFGCHSLKGDLIITDSVVTIGADAFAGCAFNGKLYIGANVSTIGENAFGENNYSSIEISELNNHLLIRDDVGAKILCRPNGSRYAIMFCLSQTSNTIKIGNGYNRIDSYAFAGCTGITSVIIDGTVSSIGTAAFKGCENLSYIEISSYYSISNGDLIFDGCSKLSKVTIKSDINVYGRVFGDYTFRDCLRNQLENSGVCGYTYVAQGKNLIRQEPNKAESADFIPGSYDSDKVHIVSDTELDAIVTKGTLFKDIGLPEQLQVSGSGSTFRMSISWNSRINTFDYAGEYTFTGTLVFSDKVENCLGYDTIIAVIHVMDIYRISVEVNNSKYGSVDTTSFTAVEGTHFTVDGHNLIIDKEIMVTASEKEADDKPNYNQFKGWSCSGLTLNGHVITGDMTITAEFEHVDYYYIIYNPNTGSSRTDIDKCDYGERTVLKDCMFTNIGYMFCGWSLDAGDDNRANYYAGSNVDLGCTDRTITLYAVWKYSPSIAKIYFDNGTVCKEVYPKDSSLGAYGDFKVHVILNRYDVNEHDYTIDINGKSLYLTMDSTCTLVSNGYINVPTGENVFNFTFSMDSNELRQGSFTARSSYGAYAPSHYPEFPAINQSVYARMNLLDDGMMDVLPEEIVITMDKLKIGDDYYYYIVFSDKSVSDVFEFIEDYKYGTFSTSLSIPIYKDTDIELMMKVAGYAIVKMDAKENITVIESDIGVFSVIVGNGVSVDFFIGYVPVYVSEGLSFTVSGGLELTAINNHNLKLCGTISFIIASYLEAGIGSSSIAAIGVGVEGELEFVFVNESATSIKYEVSLDVAPYFVTHLFWLSLKYSQPITLAEMEGKVEWDHPINVRVIPDCYSYDDSSAYRNIRVNQAMVSTGYDSPYIVALDDESYIVAYTHNYDRRSIIEYGILSDGLIRGGCTSFTGGILEDSPLLFRDESNIYVIFKYSDLRLDDGSRTLSELTDSLNLMCLKYINGTFVLFKDNDVRNSVPDYNVKDIGNGKVAWIMGKNQNTNEYSIAVSSSAIANYQIIYTTTNEIIDFAIDMIVSDKSIEYRLATIEHGTDGDGQYYVREYSILNDSTSLLYYHAFPYAPSSIFYVDSEFRFVYDFDLYKPIRTEYDPEFSGTLAKINKDVPVYACGLIETDDGDYLYWYDGSDICIVPYAPTENYDSISECSVIRVDVKERMISYCLRCMGSSWSVVYSYDNGDVTAIGSKSFELSADMSIKVIECIVSDDGSTADIRLMITNNGTFDVSGVSVDCMYNDEIIGHLYWKQSFGAGSSVEVTGHLDISMMTSASDIKLVLANNDTNQSNNTDVVFVGAPTYDLHLMTHTAESSTEVIVELIYTGILSSMDAKVTVGDNCQVVTLTRTSEYGLLRGLVSFDNETIVYTSGKALVKANICLDEPSEVYAEYLEIYQYTESSVTVDVTICMPDGNILTTIDKGCEMILPKSLGADDSTDFKGWRIAFADKGMVYAPGEKICTLADTIFVPVTEDNYVVIVRCSESFEHGRYVEMYPANTVVTTSIDCAEGYRYTIINDYDGITFSIANDLSLQYKCSNTYRVAFIYGYGSTISAGYYAYGTSPSDFNFPSPKSLVKKSDEYYDYTFDSWSPALTDVTTDVTYRAVYTKTLRSGTSTLTLMDGDEVVYTTSYNIGDYVQLSNYYSVIPGYRITMWHSGSTTFDIDDTIRMGASGRTLYASTLKLYYVNFHVDDEIVGTASGVSGETLSMAPYDVEKEHYTFKGWVYEEGSIASDGTLTIDCLDIDLYASFERIQHTVSYDVSGGSGSVDTVNVDECSEFNVDDTYDGTMPGHRFIGWSYGGELYEPGEKCHMGCSDITFVAVWSDTATISFDSDGGSDIDSITAKIGSDVSGPDDPVKIGHTFVKWQLDGKDYEFTVMPAENTVLKAVWSVNTYTISFTPIGEFPLGDIVQKYGSAVSEPVPPIVIGYEFVKWEVGGSEYEFDTMPAEDITVTPVYRIGTYTISFDTGEGTPVDDITQEYASVVVAPEDPLRAGYTFVKWQLDGEDYEIELMGAHNITLTAIWSINTYTILFDSEGGSEIESIQYTIESPDIPLKSPVRDHYIFDGWFIDQESSGSEYKVITHGSFGGFKLHAKWVPIEYTVTYYSNDLPSFATPEYYVYSTVKYTAEKDLVLIVPERFSYVFQGWYLDAYTYEEKIEKISVDSARDIELYAKWTPEIYTLTYFSNGGTEVSPTEYTFEGGPITLPVSERKGYDFAGWYDNKGLEGLSISAITSGAYEDKNLYAKWIPIEYSVSFVDNADSSIDPIEYNIESDDIDLPIPSKEDYDFIGWFYNGDLSGTSVSVIRTGSTGDIILYAKWTPTVYTLTYVSNGGNELSQTEYTVEGPFSLPYPELAFYDFVGWCVESDLSGDAILDIFGFSGDLTLYAKWSPSEYYIVCDANSGTFEDSELTVPFSKEESFIAIGTYTIESDDVYLPTKCARDGYTFVGWYFAEGESTALVSKICKGSTGDQKVCAKWSIIDYDITYHVNGGSSIESETYTVEDDVLLDTSAVKDGYIFAGWYDNESLSGDDVTEIYVGSTGNREFYAKWVSAVYDISFDTDCEFYIDDISYTIEDSIDSFEEPVRTGYTFVGWFNGDSQVTSLPVGSVGDLVLKAKWVIDVYTIKFYTDTDTIVELSGEYGSEVVAPAAEKESTAEYVYDFIGWSYDQSEIVDPPLVFSENLTIYAMYSENYRYYDVIFTADGKDISSGRYKYGETVEMPAEPTKAADDKTRFEFSSWEGYIDGVVYSDIVYNAIFKKIAIIDTGTGTDINVDVNETYANLDSESIDEIKQKAEDDPETTLTLSMGGYKVVFDSNALRNIDAGDSCLSVTKSMEDVPELKGVDKDHIYEISFDNNHDFKDGQVTISIPYVLKDGEDENNLIIYYIVDGTVSEKIKCSYSEGFITFSTNHFSTYAVANEPDAADWSAVDSGADIGLIVGSIATGVAVLLIAMFLLRRRH